jgi:cytidyltransferase-like protein
MKTVAVSGGFDPIHSGHLDLFREAKAIGDRLIVILNNDAWLEKKKGYVFMSEVERAEILRAIRYVDEVYVTNHTMDDMDISVSEALRDVKPDIFANGGDRVITNIPELAVCEELGIEMVFRIGGDKRNSSSALVRNAKNSIKE